VTFRQLIHYLADKIGRHYVPVRENAHEIREFLQPDGVHHDLIKDVVRKIYRANHCGFLDAEISEPQTLDSLGHIRAALLDSPRTDIDQFRFMEELCTYAAMFFADARQDVLAPPLGHYAQVPVAPPPFGQKAEVIRFRR
jgi:hypothetical protein